MNALKQPLTWLRQIGAQFAPQDEHEQQRDRIFAVLLALIATVALLYQFFT